MLHCFVISSLNEEINKRSQHIFLFTSFSIASVAMRKFAKRRGRRALNLAAPYPGGRLRDLLTNRLALAIHISYVCVCFTLPLAVGQSDSKRSKFRFRRHCLKLKRKLTTSIRIKIRNFNRHNSLM
eukprot:6183919-Pleurochrysis_carterae.AAC.1